ncbi:MAG: hypothetical protein BroJett038_12450 [Chloroflexota bacterium]|nr:MAG: hypothetical protein BroJett038_12450 [Chloroflexota bacterium]
MVKLVYMQTVFKMSRESYFMARHNGDLRQMQARANAEQEAAAEELSGLLEDGYSLLCSHMAASDDGDYLTFVLYKPDGGQSDG